MSGPGRGQARAYGVYVGRRQRLVDATLVNDEVDLLLLRLEYLAPYVDHFYVAESPETYTGLAKPLYVSWNVLSSSAIG